MDRTGRFLPAAILALLFPLQVWAAAPILDDRGVRQFVAAQTDAWNAHDAGRYYATFDRGARIVRIKTAQDGALQRTVTSLAEDEGNLRKLFGTTASLHMTCTVERITIASDHRTATVNVRESLLVHVRDLTKVFVDITQQTLEIRNGHIVSLGALEHDLQ